MNFSGISLSRRLYLAFGSGIVLICIAILFILQNLGRISEQADILNRPRHDTTLLAAEVAHLSWANAVQDYLLKQGKAELTVALDGRQCGFGKWFYGEGRSAFEAEVPSTVPVMAKIENVHLRLHESAVRIKKMGTEGRFTEAEALFEKESMPILREVQTHLQQAHQIYSKSTNTTIFTLRRLVAFTETAALIICVGMTLGGIILAIRFGRSITVPINKLVDYAQHISRGNFIPVPLQQKDEIGQLALAFESMVQELKEKLGVAQGIMTGLTVPFAVCDAKGILTYVNQPMLDCWGRLGKPEIYVGKNVGNFFYNDNSHETALQKCISSQEPLVDLNLSFKNFADEQKHLLINVAPLRDLDKRIIGAFALHSDLTDEIAQKARITAMHERVVESAAEGREISAQQTEAFKSLLHQLDATFALASSQGAASQQAAQNVENMAHSMRDMATKAEKSVENTEIARKEATEGAEVVQQTIACIQQVSTQSGLLEKGIRELDGFAAGINHVLDLIKDVADQTNLLALNAAIEAARAGEAGRGFAVVADEVRKLAEKTMHATGDVTDAVQSIQNGVRDCTTATNVAVTLTRQSSDLAQQSGEKLASILNMTKRTAEDVSAIASATQQQSSLSEDILQVMENITSSAELTSTSMRDSSDYVNELSSLSADLKQIIDNMISNRRVSDRIRLPNPISISMSRLGTGKKIVARLTEFSNEGLRVAYPRGDDWNGGDMVVIQLDVPNVKMEEGILRGSVAWANGVHAGIKLDATLSNSVQSALKKLIDSMNTA